MKKKLMIVGACILSTFLMFGCDKQEDSNIMKDGTYTAQMAEYDFGWKEYVTINVKNGAIVTAEFNAENAAGMSKSWDNDYMINMNAAMGTYPNEYTRFYAAQLVGQTQEPQVDALTGATSSGSNFTKLVKAVVEQALKGDSTVVYVNH